MRNDSVNVGEAIVAMAMLLILIGLPMILVAWVMVTVLSSPIGWVAAIIGSSLVSFLVGVEAGRRNRK